MKVKFNVTGSKRKQLANTIGEWLGCEVEYLGVPTFAYKVGAITIDKNGTATIPDTLRPETVENLMHHLHDENFKGEVEDTHEESVGLTVSVPLDKVSIGNLNNLLDAKGSLIKKALGIEATPIEVTETAVLFPWFLQALDSDTMKAVSHFITALCELSKSQKRVNAKEKEVDNEKYAFRCFLLRLGFIGSEYKAERKILLRNLEGSSAYKSSSR